MESDISLLESDDAGDMFGDTMKSVGGNSESSSSVLKLFTSTKNKDNSGKCSKTKQDYNF